MSMKLKPFAALFTLFACAAAFGSASAYADAARAISATNAWVRWLPSNLPAAGYVTLTNSGDTPVDIVSTSSADYGSVMLHQSVSNGSTEQMVMVTRATVPAHGQLAIAPGGYHFMLEKPTHQIAPGSTVHLKLQFSNGQTLDTPFSVKPPSQMQ
jgi:periplasmic copper chaperone A